MPKDTTVLTIPNDPSYLSTVGAYVVAVATKLGFDEQDVGDIRLAVDEACAHVIETAFEPGEEQDLTIACRGYPSGLRITIADKGLPFDPSSIKEYDARGGLDRDLLGLPFYLMQQAMDEVRFVNKGWEGKELQLTKYRQVPGIESYFTEDELRPYDTGAEPAPPCECEYRLMVPADAVEIAKCIYKTYGYTYPGESIYFPERVVTLNQSGEMISAVAVTEAGRVIGHCALSGPRGGAVMEIGQAVVAPAHRGRGVLKDLMDLLMSEARRRGLVGLYTHCVTIHPFSQRALFNYGFRESAVLLVYAHRHVRMKEFADLELPQRETVIFGYQSLDGERRRPVYPPAHHRPIISRIYQNLGLERELVLCQESHTGIEREVSHFEVTTRLAPAFGFGLIEVASYGPGIEQEVKNKLGDVCHEPTAVVYLNLPITEPETAVLCHRFEGLGFFFSGIQPRPDGRDLLCLQMLNGPRVDYDLLQIHSDFGRELVAYVRDADPLA